MLRRSAVEVVLDDLFVGKDQKADMQSDEACISKWDQ